MPANAGDTGSSPGLGGSHMPRSNKAREPQLLSLRVWSQCSTTREAAIILQDEEEEELSPAQISDEIFLLLEVKENFLTTHAQQGSLEVKRERVLPHMVRIQPFRCRGLTSNSGWEPKSCFKPLQAKAIRDHF
ncbi:hypothetical protein J1605_013540 [Eschrichtius robustus]|uniref:Uncharacterized protein n=1 Tax=Eschrichtius robustus TaxID=9764 RepID=A0AB34GEM0_ESCRO|nr:hypothetical protein J1605_013540 [Eschrichtius robustus]